MATTSDTNYDTRRTTAHAANTMAQPTVDRAEAVYLLNKVSWGAIFAGVVMALTVHLVLNLFGIGVGTATIDPATGQTPSATSISIGAAVWWTVSGIIAAFVGGFVAARLSGRPSRSTGGWHGLTTWALSTLVIFFTLTSTLGTITGGAYNAMSGTAGGIASALQNIEPAAGDVPPQVSQEVDQMTGDLQMSEVRQAIGDVLAAMISQDQSAITEARREAITIIAESRNVSRVEAQQLLDQYTQQASQTMGDIREGAAEGADTVANALSKTAWFSAIALVLGALAAWFGGYTGSVKKPAYET